MTSRRGEYPRLVEDIYTEQRTKTGPPDTTGWLILAVVVVVLAIFFAWLIYTLYRDANSADVVQRCSPGLCKFSILTGVKTCPNPGDTLGVRVTAGSEFCTSENYCQNEPFNCAVQLDQSVNCTGVCGPGNDRCRCVRDPTN